MRSSGKLITGMTERNQTVNVVLYMRYSSDRQTEQSIEGQQRICTDFCRREGHTIVGTYIDRALSASKHTEKRTEFMRMIKDSEKGTFQAVVVYKLDRFARNRYDSAIYKSKLQRNGVRLISAMENIDGSTESIILESVLEGMAEYYSKELAQKVTRGMHETALKCNSTGGSFPLGYTVKNKKLVIDETKAPLVRQIFQMYAEGETIQDICKYANGMGLKTSKGNDFNKNSFRVMLKNEKYIGIYNYNNGEVRVEGGIPAIVDKEIFDKVQKRITANKNAPARGKAKVDYLLSGKLFCGHCGSKMIGESGRGQNGTTHNYYTCASKRREKTCDKVPVKKDWIENAVVYKLAALLTPENIDLIADIAVKQSLKELEENSVIPAIEAELAEVNQGITNLLKLVERGVVSESLGQRLEELDHRRKEIEVRLDEAKTNAAAVILDKSHVIWWLTKFSNGNKDDIDFRHLLCDLLLNKVTVWDEPDGQMTIEIRTNLSESSQNGSVIAGSGSPAARCSSFTLEDICFTIKRTQPLCTLFLSLKCPKRHILIGQIGLNRSAF